jgi:solute carrier family 25 folate transporter 32
METHPILHSIAGAGAGVIASLISCPLDVTKTVLQVQRHLPGEVPKYHGVVGTLRVILQEEGIRGIYKGLGTTMIALGPNWSVYFFVYENLKRFAVQSGFKEGTMLYVATAMTAAAATDVTTSPLWMVKTRLQTQLLNGREKKYGSTLHTLRTIINEEGPRALWQGLTPQLIGVVHVAIQFPLYEHLKKKMAATSPEANLNATQIILASSVSKAAASVVAYPHEILRSRLQYQHRTDANRYKGLIDAFLRITREEGLTAFYRGMTANLLRVIPSSAITFTAYELLVQFLSG